MHTDSLRRCALISSVAVGLSLDCGMLQRSGSFSTSTALMLPCWAEFLLFQVEFMTELAFNLWRWFGLHGVLIWLANINTLVKRKFGFNKKLFPCTVLFDSYNNSVSNHPILHTAKITRFSKCT